MAVIPNRERRSIMIDLTSLTSAVGELDEKKVMSMLQEFVAGAPETEEAPRPSLHVRKAWRKSASVLKQENIS